MNKLNNFFLQFVCFRGSFLLSYYECDKKIAYSVLCYSNTCHFMLYSIDGIRFTVTCYSSVFYCIESGVCLYNVMNDECLKSSIRCLQFLWFISGRCLNLVCTTLGQHLDLIWTTAEDPALSIFQFFITINDLQQERYDTLVDIRWQWIVEHIYQVLDTNVLTNI